MRNKVFVKRRLRQLVREELERTDLKALVREVAEEVVREQLDELYGPVQQRRPKLKVVE